MTEQFRRDIRAMFWGGWASLPNPDAPPRAVPARVPAPLPQEHVATGSVPAGPSEAEVRERFSSRMRKLQHLRAPGAGRMASKAGLFEVAAAAKTIPQELGEGFAILKTRMALKVAQGGEAVLAAAFPQEALETLAQNAILAHRVEGVVKAAILEQQRLESQAAELERLEARAGSLTPESWRRLKDLRRLRKKGLI